MGGVYGKSAPPTQIPEQSTSHWCNGSTVTCLLIALKYQDFFFCQGIVGQRGENGEEGAKGEEVHSIAGYLLKLSTLFMTM